MDFLPDIGREPDYGLAGNPSFAVDKTQFGDGYQQRRPAGLNSARRKWSVSWTLLEREQMEALRQFLMSRLGVYAFYWEVPEEDQALRVVCEEPPTDTYDGYRYYSLSATFTEDFGL
jgi:phage-related protein